MRFSLAGSLEPIPPTATWPRSKASNANAGQTSPICRCRELWKYAMCNAQSRPPPWLFQRAPSRRKRAPVFFPLLSLVSIYPIFRSSAYQTTVIPERPHTFTATMLGSAAAFRSTMQLDSCSQVAASVGAPLISTIFSSSEKTKMRGTKRAPCAKAAEREERRKLHHDRTVSHRLLTTCVPHPLPPPPFPPPRLVFFGHFHFAGRGLSLKRVVGCRDSHRNRNFLFRRLRNGRVLPDRSYSI